MAADSTIQHVLDGDARWCIHHGDVLDALPLIPDESVDAVVCDAPYGLGEEPDPVALLRAWLDGIDAKTNSVGFMNRKWDVVPGPNYWRECFRILKPGGYLLTFAGTRTQHWFGVALSLAGFEIRDSIAFLHGQGMSKNVNLERQIAMHQCTLPGRHFASTLPKGAKARPGDHLCPETEESVKWKGQGSALAPAHEPIIVARKPLRGTYAENTLAYGTALNIEATRIGVSKDVPSSPRIGPFLGGFANDQGTGTGFDPNIGRWPKNVVLCHSEHCQRIGTTYVGANPTWDTPNRDTEPSAFTGSRVSKVRHGREGEASSERRYNGNGSTSFAATPGPRRDAVEDVAVYRCVEGCPVALLAAQSGESNSKASTKRNGNDSEVSTWALNREREDLRGHNDSGTAARYFQQFHTSEFDEPFRYQAKPSRREKDAGLQHFRPRSGAEVTCSGEDDARLNCGGRTGAGAGGGVRNPHPTTKSVELCRWLVRLVARPGQLVCVPFAGSGSECVGALLEGCRVVGVELMDTDEEPYVSVARARCEYIDGREFVPLESLRTKEPPRQQNLF